MPDLRLRTARLLLRTPDAADVPALLAYQLANRAFFQPWEPQRTEAYFNPVATEQRVVRLHADAASGTGLGFCLFDLESGTLLGSCNFSAFQRGVAQYCNLGFALAEKAQGRGLMFEALSVALPYVFGPLNFHRVQANYMPRNVRSGALLARLGFVPEGLARNYLRINGRWEDHLLTSLTHPDWQEAPNSQS